MRWGEWFWYIYLRPKTLAASHFSSFNLNVNVSICACMYVHVSVRVRVCICMRYAYQNIEMPLQSYIELRKRAKKSDYWSCVACCTGLAWADPELRAQLIVRMMSYFIRNNNPTLHIGKLVKSIKSIYFFTRFRDCAFEPNSKIAGAGWNGENEVKKIMTSLKERMRGWKKTPSGIHITQALLLKGIYLLPQWRDTHITHDEWKWATV